MKMRIGADHSALGNTEGIHWHINSNVEIEYAADNKRQTIPWIKYKDKSTGKELIFTDQNVATFPKPDSLKKLEHRIMDCMDCHNRPSHEYLSPSHYVNELFAGNKIPKSLPYLKMASMEALKGVYSTKDSAYLGIDKQITDYYKSKYPDLLKKYQKEIKKAITRIQTEFSYNTFPEMKVRYTAYPRNIGHLEFKGCFRCHDNNHKTKDGKVISKDCNLCHTIVGQGTSNAINYVPINGNIEFQHPVDIGDEWKTTNCSECHLNLF